MKETSYLSYRRFMGESRITIMYREIGLINLGSTREKCNGEDGGNKYSGSRLLRLFWDSRFLITITG
jgi:hypothetical protein